MAEAGYIIVGAVAAFLICKRRGYPTSNVNRPIWRGVTKQQHQKSQDTALSGLTKRRTKKVLAWFASHNKEAMLGFMKDNNLSLAEREAKLYELYEQEFSKHRHFGYGHE